MGAQKRKADLNKLKNSLRDLQDDSNDITTINRNLSELGEGIVDALECEKTNTIVNIIESNFEPYSYSDRELSSAAENLKKEISALEKEIEAEEEAERVAREAGGLLRKI